MTTGWIDPLTPTLNLNSQSLEAHGMSIPSFIDAEIPLQKLMDYLLRPDHPEGASKAKFFLARGFSVERWEQFAEALREQAMASTVSDIVEGRFGTKFVVDGQIRCPDASTHMIRSVWIVPHGKDNPRLVTAHPLG